MNKGLTTEELALVVLERQVEAVTRAVVLIGKHKKITFNDVLRELAHAEKKAQFICGFEALNGDEEYKIFLKKHLLEKNFITISAEDYVILTEAGQERANIKLPPQIEQQLSK